MSLLKKFQVRSQSLCDVILGSIIDLHFECIFVVIVIVLISQTGNIYLLLNVFFTFLEIVLNPSFTNTNLTLILAVNMRFYSTDLCKIQSPPKNHFKFHEKHFVILFYAELWRKSDFRILLRTALLKLNTVIQHIEQRYIVRTRKLWNRR